MSKYQSPNLPSVFTGNQDQLRQLDKDLVRELNNWDLHLKAILDRGISLGDNVDCRVVSYTTNATPDSEDVVAHGLGRVPSYFVVADINKGGVVYRSGTAFSKSSVYLKCSAAAAAVKLILI